MRAWRRLRQFVRAQRPPLGDSARDEVAKVLNPAEGLLFSRLTRMDQRHSYDVYRHLLGAGERDARVLRAALLHDIGKLEAPLSAVERSLLVVARALSRGRWPAVGGGPGFLGRYPRYLDHARRGQALLEAAGVEPEVVELAAAHEEATAGAAGSLRRADERF